MSIRCAHSLLRAVLITTGALVFIGMVEIRTASAACGDWLDHASKSASNYVPSKSGPQHGHQLAPKSHPCPCHGPMCQQCPLKPAMPAPFLPTLHDGKDVVCGKWCWHVDGELPRPEMHALDLAEACSGFPDRIDHPPRA